jgi:hypothetical protein
MRSSPWTRRLTAAALAVGCVVPVVLCGELSSGALLGVGIGGGAVAALGVARRSGEAARPVGRRALPWAGWLAAVLGWELVALSDVDLPTVSDLADPLLAHPAARGVATLGWLAAGGWLLARPRHRTAPS